MNFRHPATTTVHNPGSLFALHSSLTGALQPKRTRGDTGISVFGGASMGAFQYRARRLSPECLVATRPLCSQFYRRAAGEHECARVPRRASHGIRRLLVHPPRHRVPLLTAAPAPTSTDPARLFAFRPSSRTPRPALRPSRGARHGGRPHRYARPPRPLHPPAARPSREAVPAAASRNIRPLVLVCTNGGEGGRTKRGAPTAPRRKSNAAARGSHAQRRGRRRASSRSHHSRNHVPRSP